MQISLIQFNGEFISLQVREWGGVSQAAVDFSVDMRNNDPVRTWDHGFVDVQVVTLDHWLHR